MAYVKVGKNESIESAIKRFNKKVDDEKIVKEYRNRRYYIKPSAVKREKIKVAKRKQAIKAIKNEKKNGRR